MIKLPKGIRKRGSRFIVDVTIAGKRRTATCPTLSAAIQQHAILKTGVDTSTAIKADTWTLTKAVDYTRQHVWSGSKSEKVSGINSESAIVFFGGDTPVTALNETKLDAWVIALKNKGNTNATINRKLAALSKVLHTVKRVGILDKLPHFPKQKEQQSRIRFITENEERTMITTCREWGYSHHADVLAFLIDTGLRTGELWKLESRDVDLDQKMITLWDTKSGQPRSIPLTKRALAIVSTRLSSDHPFPYSKAWLRVVWDKLEVTMNLTKDPLFRPYCTRHTCASRLVQRGVGLQVVQAWLGHSDIKMTLRYASLSVDNLRAAAKTLD